MRVPAVLVADERLAGSIRKDPCLQQLANTAHLPGVVGAAMAMPDVHWGYGFPVGGVAATDIEEGVVSPGGIGYDINCGVRLIRTDLSAAETSDRLPRLADALFAGVPCGVGRGGSVRLKGGDLDRVLTRGAGWAVERGMGWASDLERIESGGALDGADPDPVSQRARERGRDQCGTLGSGNHFLEVQTVAEIHEASAAEAFGLFPGQVVVMIHSGSRGLGHQVCTDALRVCERSLSRYGILLPDRQLACVPIRSPEGEAYLGAMRAAANFAMASRQIMTHLTRAAFEKVFGLPSEGLGMHLVQDVAHNIAKFEEHSVDGRRRTVCVHRKGATRAFPPGHAELPDRYRRVGQPVLIPGDMGRCSYVLAGRPGSMEHAFGSTCHGAGRQMSRGEARRRSRGRPIAEELLARNIHVRAQGRRTLMEEIPEAYKDVRSVVGVVEGAGLSVRVARLKPLCVIKG
jgi:tRNA-splicing ligase RtcB